MRFLARSLTALFLFAITLGLLALAGATLFDAVQERSARTAQPRPAQERVFAVQVVTVTPETVTPVLETFGEIRARRTLELRAPASGRVVELAPGFEDGGTVAEGQLLMRIDPADAEAGLAVALSDLARAEGEAREAEAALDLAAEDLASAEEQAGLRARALERQRDLSARGVGAEAATEAAELALSAARQAVVSRRQALAQAEARREQAGVALARQRLTVEEAERRLADTELRAAFAGTLAGVTVAAGGLVSANERIGQLIDPAALEVSFRVSTAQFARLIDGAGALLPAPVAVTLEVMGAEIVATGTLERVSGAVGEGQSGRLLHAGLDAPRGFLPGDFVTVRVAEPEIEGVARLPARAVDASGRVLVVDAGDRLAEAPVTVLRRQGDAVLVSAPALAGAEVVAARTPLLGAGIRVRPVRPGTAAEPEEETVALTPSRRAELIAAVESNARMPAEARARMVEQLGAERVPAALVARIEARIGG